MLKLRYSKLILIYAVLCTTVRAVAGDTNQLDQVLKTVVAALPPSWTVVKQQSNEIPYGHHWGENYTGPTGILVVAKGVRPVNAEFSDTNGKWRTVHVATEALEIWLMPGNYSDSLSSRFTIGRPVQPIVVVGHGPINVYASQWATLLSVKYFNDILKQSTAVRWPDPQVDSSEFLTWKNWRIELKKPIEKALAK